MSQISTDELNWGLVAWIIPLAGGILGFIVKPESNYVKHWSYLSIAFGIVIIVVSIILDLLSLATMLLPPLFIIIKALSILVGLAFVIIWIVGIVRERNSMYWKPALIYDVAKMLGSQ
ncbi:hypothetical protein [Caldivirga sp. UBA161]|uniref:hypothetical protein n=1 Tax=Caldivirga sp. UBA161 TaxID=1915569 RepID=UPI0025C5B8D6|nr:hypothetical protein [Caldivirga sp. UBA161]